MNFLSKTLKVLAQIVGVLCIVYGFFIGILGLGPDGPHSSLLIHLLGIYVLTLGISYFLPNRILAFSTTRKRIYYVTTASPTIIMLILATYTAATEGIDAFYIQDICIQVPAYFLLSSFAPLSLMTFRVST